MYLSEGGDALNEDDEDDDPSEEETEREVPHHSAHLVHPVRLTQHLVTAT